MSANEPVTLTWKEGAERVFNLLITLINYGPQSLSWLANNVDGYGGPFYLPQDHTAKESAEQQLRRDRTLLAKSGVHIATRTTFVDDGTPQRRKETVWSIKREDFELPDLSFSEEEADVISAAGRWAFTHNMSRAAQSAYAKLSALGIQRTESSSIMSNVPDQTTLDSDSIDALFTALDQHTVIKFFYYPSLVETPVERTVEPWAYGAIDGKTYLTGFDVDRGQQRTFRLSRIDSIEDTGQPGTHETPDGDPQKLIAHGVSHAGTQVTAIVKFLTSGAHELRAMLQEDGKTIGPMDREQLIRTAASYAPDAIITSPQDIVDDVIQLLQLAARQEGK